MNNNDTTLKIMQKVADEEIHRVRQTLLIVLPVTLILTVAIIITSERTIVRLVEKDTFRLFTTFEYNTSKFTPQTMRIFKSFWEEITEGFLAITIVCSVTLYLLISKSKIVSYPKRFKEIKKYINKI